MSGGKDTKHGTFLLCLHGQDFLCSGDFNWVELHALRSRIDVMISSPQDRRCIHVSHRDYLDTGVNRTGIEIEKCRSAGYAFIMHTVNGHLQGQYQCIYSWNTGTLHGNLRTTVTYPQES